MQVSEYKESKNNEKKIEGDWGYAIVDKDVIWVPCIRGDMKSILKMLYQKTGIRRMIFSAVLDPEQFKTHLRNVVKEWDAWFEQVGDWSHCIEIYYDG